jgi:hypothetical protein
MKKSELLRAVQAEIHKHNLSTFMDEKHKVVIKTVTLTLERVVERLSTANFTG